MESVSAVRGLAALASEGRLAVFRMLVQAGSEGIAAGEIARRLGVPASSMSATLNVLSRAELIVGQRQSRSIIYRAAFPRMTALLSYLVEDCCQGSPTICAPLAAVVGRADCGSEEAAGC